MLFSSVQYPGDYGFITDTLGEDSDPLDAIVLIWEPTFPGCMIVCCPIGLFKMQDEKGIDDKILCVPLHDPMWNQLKDIDEVPPHLLIEIEHFFKIYKELEKKKTGIDGWYSCEQAIKVINEARERFKQEQ